MREKIYTLENRNELETLGRILSPKKLEVLSLIAKNESLSIGEIGKKIKINRSFLTETLHMFQSLNLITFTREGRKKIPKINSTSFIINF